VAIASVAANIYLYGIGRSYYLEANSTRLDPYGIGEFAVSEKNNNGAIIFFGDSRAADWPAPTNMMEADFINRGIGSQTSTQVLGRFAAHVSPLQLQKIVVQVGINDLKAIPLFPDRREEIVANCKANLQEIVKLSLDAGAEKVILTTIFPFGQISPARRLFWSDDVAIAIREVNDFLRSLESDQVIIFDAYRLLVGADGLVQPQYVHNFLHLNAEGYALLNQELVQILRE